MCISEPQVEKRVDNLVQTLRWALYEQFADPSELEAYLLSCMFEISIRYSSIPIIDFAIGDIVDVNYGSHLPGEINGGHVFAIVCNILGDMVYVVPITKATKPISSRSYLYIKSEDANFNNEFDMHGIVLIDKGKYVRAERLNSVLGKTKCEFFQKLLHQLASTFDFTTCHSSTLIEETPTTGSTPKVVNKETFLSEFLGFALQKIDSSKKIEEQVELFLTDIGMTTTEKVVTQAFIISCDIRKINYENVLLELHERFYAVNEEIIQSILKEAFKNWLKKYPTLAEKYPKISLMDVLKVFAKKRVAATK